MESFPQQERRDTGTQFAQLLTGIETILNQQPPEQWWKKIYMHLKRHERQLQKYPPDIREQLDDELSAVFQVMRSHTAEQPNEIAQAKAAEQAMKAIANLLLKAESHETEPIEVRFISLNEIVQDTKHFAWNAERNEIKIFSEGKQQWYAFPMPQSEHVYHKGGASRVTLKMLAGAPQEIIETELPPNDIDMITSEPREVAEQEAARMGVDLKSMEMVKQLDFPALFKTRDVGLNMAFLGRQGLVYAQAGFEEAQTGKIVLHGDNPGIYGKHTFELEPGVRLAKPGGMARLLKTVAEGKALSFDFLPANEQVDLGTMWLYLAGRKFINKPNRAELLNRLFHLGKQMGQVREGEQNIIAVLDRVHTENPNYSVIESKLDNIYLVRWLHEKFAATLEQRFREKHKLGPSLPIERGPADTEPYEVSLADYKSSQKLNAFVDEQWDAFLERCAKRSTL